MMSLHPGGVIISWEPDCSSQVMAMITSSPESFLQPLDLDNGQLEHTYYWDCLCIPLSLPLSLFLCLFEPITHVSTSKDD
jgi:hypothetical protein